MNVASLDKLKRLNDLGYDLGRMIEDDAQHFRVTLAKVRESVTSVTDCIVRPKYSL